MIQLKVNGKEINTDKNCTLLTFLRDDLRFNSVKDGCSEGSCGSCTVIIDGKAVKACTRKLNRLDGCSIITVEGLSDREKDVYSYTFKMAGAVQCGFCTPGMVMSGKALIDLNNNPSESEITKAISGNICRCTGYKKIIKAIQNAAEYLREKREIPQENYTGYLDSDYPRIDADIKTLGKGIYTDDMYLDGMVYGSALRSEYPRAKILDIDLSEALKHPDTIGILTADDIPGINKTGHLVKDWDVLIAKGDITRYAGDAVVLVVSKTKESLNEIKNLVTVKYEELTPLTSPGESLKPGAPNIHEKGNILSIETLKRGEDVEEVFKKSAYVVNKRYSTPFTDHAFLETECAVAIPEENGVTVYTGSQSIYDEKREIAPVLGIDENNVRCISNLVGGAFGGKEDMSVQHHAALMSYVLKVPVKVKLNRQESLLVHPKRHAMDIDITLSCDEKGKLTAMKADIVSDTGAYASLGGPVLQRACTHAAGPYNYQNISIKGTAVYTNNPPAGAFRGFGVPQSNFAMESSLNLLAEKAGLSPFEIRYINAVKPGDVLPNGQFADDSTALLECLDKVRDVYFDNKYSGVACALKNSGLGVGVRDTGRCRIIVKDEKVNIYTSAARVGQGLDTVIMQIACETLKISPEMIIIHRPDTSLTPNSGTTTASRQTLFTGEAVRRSSSLLADEMNKYMGLAGAEQMGNRNKLKGKTILKVLKDLEGKEFYSEYTGVTDPINSTKKNPVSHIAYSYGAQVAVLDENGKVEKIAAAYDVGQVVNRKGIEGQIEGGVVMDLGYALTEDFPLDKCIPKVRFGTLGLFRADKVPEIETCIVDKDYRSCLAYGSKGIGEIAAIPTAAAVQGAYYNLDGIFRTSLPLENTFYSRKKTMDPGQ
jgi:selenium-dependent xanthine dehydrogenase